jgi:hypothetical protein
MANRQSPQNGYARIDMSEETALKVAINIPKYLPNSPPFQIDQDAMSSRMPTNKSIQPPGVLTAHDVAATVPKEAGVGQRRDSPDHIWDPGEHDHDRANAIHPIAAWSFWSGIWLTTPPAFARSVRGGCGPQQRMHSG